MQESDKSRYIKAINALAATKGREIDVPLIEGYWIGLEDLTIEQLEMVCRRAIKTCRYFPSTMELLELAGVVSPEQRAFDAWPSVMFAAAGSRVDLDPVAAEVVRRMGGLKALGQTNEADLRVWGKKEFVRLYIDASRVSEARKMLPYPFEPLELTDGR
jgi:hypothetical protein